MPSKTLFSQPILSGKKFLGINIITAQNAIKKNNLTNLPEKYSLQDDLSDY